MSGQRWGVRWREAGLVIDLIIALFSGLVLLAVVLVTEGVDRASRWASVLGTAVAVIGVGCHAGDVPAAAWTQACAGDLRTAGAGPGVVGRPGGGAVAGGAAASGVGGSGTDAGALDADRAAGSRSCSADRARRAGFGPVAVIGSRSWSISSAPCPAGGW